MISLTDKQINKSMHYLMQLKKIHEARQAKASSVNFRKHILEREKVKNYQNELDRVYSEIDHNFMRGLTSHKHIRRKNNLENLIKNIS
tara:strand:+ start:358 stop:621 length:264 start_codon:yes stop_codon:yes gene_type:complete